MKISSTFFIKILLITEIILILLSPKALKILIGYEGIYPNPQFLFFLLIAPLLLYFNVFDFSSLRKFYDILLVIMLIVSIYFLSAFISLINLYVDPYYPISESFRQFLNYFIIFFIFLFLRSEYLIFSLKFIVFYGLFNFLFVVYGILVYFQILEAPNFLSDTIIKSINNQSWTAFGFIPKWGGFFPETQILSTYYLICYISIDLLETKIGKRKVYTLYKYLFGMLILLLMSKSTTPAFLFYLFFKKLNISSFKRRFVYFLLTLAIIISYIIITIENEIYSLFDNSLEELALKYSSIGERIFHIVKSFEYMSDNIIGFFFGLGPRTYGSLVSSEYPQYFNEYTNAISVFNILSDIGIVGFSSFLLFLYIVFMKIKDNVLKVSYIAVLLAYTPQVAWGDSFIYLFLSFLINYSYSFKFTNYEAILRRPVL